MYTIQVRRKFQCIRKIVYIIHLNIFQVVGTWEPYSHYHDGVFYIFRTVKIFGRNSGKNVIPTETTTTLQLVDCTQESMMTEKNQTNTQVTT